jgi:hypothetical protein
MGSPEIIYKRVAAVYIFSGQSLPAGASCVRIKEKILITRFKQ